MRATILCGLLVLAVRPTLAAAEVRSAAPQTAVTAIGRVLDQLHAAAARADGAAYFGLYAQDAVFIGTDVGERWTIEQFRAYAQPHFARGEGWVYTVRQRHVNLAAVACGCVAWFDEVLNSEKYGTSRGSGMLLLTPAGWKIEQYALTFPLPNELAGDITQRVRDYERDHRSP